MNINNLTIPDFLSSLIAKNEWNGIRRLKNCPGHTSLCFYSYEQMETETMGLVEDYKIHVGDESEVLGMHFFGTAKKGCVPGNLDPSQSILIGDVGFDAPFSLDFRSSMTNPQVIFFNSKLQWTKIADNIQDFWELIETDLKKFCQIINPLCLDCSGADLK